MKVLGQVEVAEPYFKVEVAGPYQKLAFLGLNLLYSHYFCTIWLRLDDPSQDYKKMEPNEEAA